VMWWGASAPQPVTYPELPSPIMKEDFERLADECLHKVMQAESEGSEEGWTPIEFQALNGEEEVKVWDKSVPGSPVNCIKTQSVMPCSAKRLFGLLCEDDLAKRQEYEKECTLYETIRQITPEISVTRAQYKAPIVASREVIAMRARRRLPGGVYVSFGKSINYDECLTDSNQVRAALHLVGAICRPIPGEPNRCVLTRVAQLDPKGNIPAMVVNATKKKSGNSVILLRKVIRRRNFPEEVEEEDENEVREKGKEKEDKQEHHLDDRMPHHAGDGDRNEKEEEEEEDQDEKGRRQEDVTKAKGLEWGVPSSDTGGRGRHEEEVFYEVGTSLPWDEKPFKQMYDRHTDQIKCIISSLQQSLDRLEELARSNEQRLQRLERLLPAEPTHPSAAPRPQVDLTNLSWGALAFLAAWPVVAYSLYDAISSRVRRPPPK